MIKLKLTAICFGALMSFSGCGGNTNTSEGDTSKMKSFGLNSNSNILLGAGNNSVMPLFSKLFAEYGKSDRVRVNYQSIGSQAGIMSLIKRAVDFAAPDTLLTNIQTKQMKADVLLIPICSDTVPNIRSNDIKDGQSINRFNWIVIYKEQNYDGRGRQRAEKLVKMLWWDIHDGQKYCSSFNYAPLPPQAIINAEKILRSATFDNKPLLP